MKTKGIRPRSTALAVLAVLAACGCSGTQAAGDSKSAGARDQGREGYTQPTAPPVAAPQVAVVQTVATPAPDFRQPWQLLRAQRAEADPCRTAVVLADARQKHRISPWDLPAVLTAEAVSHLQCGSEQTKQKFSAAAAELEEVMKACSKATCRSTQQTGVVLALAASWANDQGRSGDGVRLPEKVRGLFPAGFGALSAVRGDRNEAQ